VLPGIPPDPLTPFSELGLDSLDRVELVMAIEESLKIKISNADAERFRCLQDVIDYVERHGKEPN